MKKIVAPALGFVALVFCLLAVFGLVCGIGYLNALISGMPVSDLRMLLALAGEGLLIVFQVCVILVAVGLMLSAVWLLSVFIGKDLLGLYAKWRLRKNKVSTESN